MSGLKSFDDADLIVVALSIVQVSGLPSMRSQAMLAGFCKAWKPWLRRSVFDLMIKAVVVSHVRQWRNIRETPISFHAYLLGIPINGSTSVTQAETLSAALPATAPAMRFRRFSARYQGR